MSHAPPMPLIGRVTEMAELTAALDDAVRGRGTVRFVVGEGGIGKTRLVTELGEVAARKGFAKVVGRSYPVETGIPYALFADAFLPLLRALPPSMLQVLARGSVAELAAMFPAFRADAPSLSAIADDEVRPRLFDAFTRFVQRLAQREPQLVVLENLHWSDPSSLELLHNLARTASAHRLVLLCTYDDTRRDANATLRATEQSLHSLDVLQTHHVGPLTKDETLELVRRQFAVTRDAVVAFADKLHERTQGNPFFIEETIEALAASGALRQDGVGGAWTGWEVADLGTPRTVRDAISARFDRLSADARRVATIAAVVGAQVSHQVIESLAGLGADALLAAIDELRHERLLAERTVQRELRYEFTHPLLREVLYTSLSRARATRMHGEVAGALERHYGNNALAHADAIAVHFLSADDPEHAAHALKYLVAAGRSALERGANHEASRTLEAALVLADGAAGVAQTDPGGTVEQTLDLYARTCQRLGAFARATELWTRASALASARGDHLRVAAHARRLGVVAFREGRYDDALAHYDRGLAAASSHEASTAALLLARGTVLLEVGRPDDAAAEIRRALTIGERLGEPALLSRAHHAMQMHAVWRGPADAAREHGQRALAYAHEAGELADAWWAEWAFTTHCGLTGDSAGVAHHAQAARAIAEQLHSPVHRLWTDEVTIEYLASVGEWTDAIAVAERTIADARAYSQHTLLPRLLVWTSLIRFDRGELDVGAACMEEAWALSGAARATEGVHVNVHAVVPAHVSRSAWHVARREFRAALLVAEAGIAIADRTGYSTWAVHRLLPLAAEAALELRDFESAHRHGTRLRADAERLGHSLGLAWADGCFALIEVLQGDKRAAIPKIERAAVALEAIPFVHHAARVRRVLADAYYETGDTESAVRELRRIHETFSRMGAQPALDSVRLKLRQLGVRPPSRSPGEGAGALTARELEIARLVAARKSNKEIGATLEISARTVGTHLSNIFAKLDVDSRGALTDLVREGALGEAAE